MHAICLYPGFYPPRYTIVSFGSYPSFPNTGMPYFSSDSSPPSSSPTSLRHLHFFSGISYWLSHFIYPFAGCPVNCATLVHQVLHQPAFSPSLSPMPSLSLDTPYSHHPLRYAFLSPGVTHYPNIDTFRTSLPSAAAPSPPDDALAYLVIHGPSGPRSIISTSFSSFPLHCLIPTTLTPSLEARTP